MPPGAMQPAGNQTAPGAYAPVYQMASGTSGAPAIQEGHPMIDPSSNDYALTTTQPRSLLAMSFADPNQVSTTFKPGEIWSTARDGATGLDAKTKKKLWNRLKREVIYRDSPEDLEDKQREKDKKDTLEYRETDEYKERVSVDLAAARLKIVDRAKEIGANMGMPYLPQPTPPESDDDADSDEEGIPSRQDLFLARVLTEQRIMAQLRPTGAVALTKEPPGLLNADIKALAAEAAKARAVEFKEKRAASTSASDIQMERKGAKSDATRDDSSARDRKHDHHHRKKKSRHRDDNDDDDDRRRDHRHRRRRRD